MAEIKVDVKNIDLPWNPKRKQLKGFTYIECSEPAQVVRVVALNGANFHGSNIAASVAALNLGVKEGAARSGGREDAYAWDLVRLW
jgi:hypothetical protein